MYQQCSCTIETDGQTTDQSNKLYAKLLSIDYNLYILNNQEKKKVNIYIINGLLRWAGGTDDG